MALVDVTEALVATIVSESQLALNRGRKAGIKEGDIVILSRGVEVVDPVTKEMLGRVSVQKLRLLVTLVADKYCVARVNERANLPASRGFQFKTISDDILTDINDPARVYVEVGETAKVRRDDDEPPF